MNAEGRIAHS